jgi:hypothetical protein
MARYKTYDYRERGLLPVSLEDQLMPATLEFDIHTLVEKRLDMAIFHGKYRNDGTGRAAFNMVRPHSAIGYRTPAPEAIEVISSDLGYAMLRRDLWLNPHPNLKFGITTGGQVTFWLLAGLFLALVQVNHKEAGILPHSGEAAHNS